MVPDPDPPPGDLPDAQSPLVEAVRKERAALVRIARLLGRQIARESHHAPVEGGSVPLAHIDKLAP